MKENHEIMFYGYKMAEFFMISQHLLSPSQILYKTEKKLTLNWAHNSQAHAMLREVTGS